MKEKLVIIGAVAAGTKAASKARRENPDLEIKIYTKDKYVSYAGCGLPYYISGVISDKSELLVRSPEDFKVEQNINIFIKHEVIEINPEIKEISIRNLDTDLEFSEKYDRLIIASGAVAVVPALENVDLEGIHTLRSIDDAFAIRDGIDKGKIRKAVVVGGGFIGVEAAENLHMKGVEVVLVELFDHILPPFDEEMALLVQNHMNEMGIKVITGEKVTGFEGKDRKVKLVKTTGGNFEADVVILSIGVKPNVKFLKDSGIELGVTGAIKVNEFMQTSVPDIFAAGDCAENVQLVTGKAAWFPMGSTANKTGRIAGQNAAFPCEGSINLEKMGDKNFCYVNKNWERLKGVVGTAVVKIGDINAARTGLTERDAIKEGYDYESIIVPANDIAHYYPGHKEIISKLIIDKVSGKILGAQVVGAGVVDKPIDIYVTAMTMGATYEQLSKLDLAYAPPFNMAMGSNILAANVMKNKMTGKVKSFNSKELKEMMKIGNANILDVREEIENFISSIPDSTNIPLAELEKRSGEINKEVETIILVCKVGRRAFIAYQKLKNLGFENVSILEGGTTAYPYEKI